MFRLPSQLALLFLLLGSGCMHQPMYQPGYGQPMYGPGYAAPGTIVVPQSNAPPYVPGSTYDNPNDDFKSNGSTKDGRFFSEDGEGGVPPAKDPDASGEPFNNDPLGNK